MVFIHTPVRKDQDVRPLFVCAVTGYKETFYGTLQRGPLVIEQGDGRNFELWMIHVPDLHQIHTGQNGIVDL